MLCNLSMFQFCGRASLCLCCVFISCFFFCIWSSLVSVLVCLVSFSSGLGVFLGSLCLGGPFSLLVCVFLLGFCLGGVSLVWFFLLVPVGWVGLGKHSWWLCLGLSLGGGCLFWGESPTSSLVSLNEYQLFGLQNRLPCKLFGSCCCYI